MPVTREAKGKKLLERHVWLKNEAVDHNLVLGEGWRASRAFDPSTASESTAAPTAVSTLLHCLHA